MYTTTFSSLSKSATSINLSCSENEANSVCWKAGQQQHVLMAGSQHPTQSFIADSVYDIVCDNWHIDELSRHRCAVVFRCWSTWFIFLKLFFVVAGTVDGNSKCFRCFTFIFALLYGNCIDLLLLKHRAFRCMCGTLHIKAAWVCMYVCYIENCLSNMAASIEY